MASPIPPLPPADSAGADIAGLFSHFGPGGAPLQYHEVARQEAARAAARRWPLLAEMQGVTEGDDAPDAPA